MNVGAAFGRAVILFAASAILIAVLILGVILPGRVDNGKNDALIAGLSSGNDNTRAAALSLADKGDARLIAPAVQAFNDMKNFKGDMILAMGMLPSDRLKPENAPVARDFLTGLLKKPALNLKEKRLALWAIGNLKIKEALPFIEAMLRGVTDIATLCVGIDAMGKIGSPSSLPALTEALYRFNKTAACPKTAYVDHTGREVLLSSKENIALKMLRAVEAVNDPASRDELVKMSKDASFPEAARTEAARIADSMKQ
jgi:HEAT repeat protein